jgi:hypothetical protein
MIITHWDTAAPTTIAGMIVLTVLFGSAFRAQATTFSLSSTALVEDFSNGNTNRDCSVGGSSSAQCGQNAFNFSGGAAGAGSALARAGFDKLGASAQASVHPFGDAFGDGRAIGDANFLDTLTIARVVNGVRTGFDGFIEINGSLDGSGSQAANNTNGSASGVLELQVFDASSGANGGCSVSIMTGSGPTNGVTSCGTRAVLFGPTDVIEISGELTAEAEVFNPGTIDPGPSQINSADFLDTAEITGIQVFDQNMKPVNDAVITAASGSQYPGAATSAPEPRTLGFLLIALGLGISARLLRKLVRPGGQRAEDQCCSCPCSTPPRSSGQRIVSVDKGGELSAGVLCLRQILIDHRLTVFSREHRKGLLVMILLTKKRLGNTPQRLAVCMVLACAAVSRVSADTVYGANENTGQLQVINTATNTVSNLIADADAPRGLTFTNPNNIVYTNFFTGKLDDYNLTTHTSSVLATVSSGGVYLTLDPSGKSVVFGVGGAGIDRINLSTHALTNVSSSPDPRGLAYDSAGHLFAVLGPNELAQINPLSGTVIASIALPGTGSAGSNGLAFDPVSGELFVTDDTNNLSARGLYEVPTDLASATLVNTDVFANGLTADGKGNVWIAGNNNLEEYNTTTDKLTIGASDGLFDVAIAPAAVTNPNPTPEPASLLLLGIGLGAVGVLRKPLCGRIERRHAEHLLNASGIESTDAVGDKQFLKL